MVRFISVVVMAAVAMGCLETQVPMASNADVTQDSRASAVATTEPPAPDAAGETTRSEGDVAQSSPPCLAFTPERTEFEPVAVGSQATRAVSLRNCGETTLALTGLTMGGPDAGAFELVHAQSFPRYVSPGESWIVHVTFAPTTGGAVRANLHAVADGTFWDAELLADGVATRPVTSTLAVELIWRTPFDGNETDTGFDAEGQSVGSDVDLHFRHPDADGWFDSTFDVYWNNTEPSWDVSGPEVTLDRDDSDGAGPEFLTWHPRTTGTFTIGVQYWDDWGFGSAHATVKVFREGELVWTSATPELTKGDFWEVATITWPGGVVQPIGSADLVIIPDFPVPQF